MVRIMFQIKNLLNKNFVNRFQTSLRRIQTITALQQKEVAVEKKQDDIKQDIKQDVKAPLDDVSQKLMSFFEIPENWGQTEVRSGRPWRMDELRIKSNEDLHKLWFILYKERNMLLTMQHATKLEVINMPSPERIDKVEESMKNIEEVIKERNKAYYQLEVGDDQYVERRRVYRKDVFGRYRWIASNEHLIPYWMNTKFRLNNGPGFGPDVLSFNRKLREKKLNSKLSLIQRQRWYCRQLMRRFPNMDMEYLKELYPDVDIEPMKEQLDEICLQDRVKPFSSIFYKTKKNRL